MRRVWLPGQARDLADGAEKALKTFFDCPRVAKVSK